MPYGLCCATVVQLGESFLLVGGYYEADDFPIWTDGDLDTIWKYEPSTDSWTLLDTKIPFRMEEPIALMVDIDIFPDCAQETENDAH